MADAYHRQCAIVSARIPGGATVEREVGEPLRQWAPILVFTSTARTLYSPNGWSDQDQHPFGPDVAQAQ